MRPAGAGLAAVRLYYVSHAPIGVRVRCCSYTYGTPARDMAGFTDGIDGLRTPICVGLRCSLLQHSVCIQRVCLQG